jgi:membrane protease YdiL (CAAX protease family)
MLAAMSTRIERAVVRLGQRVRRGRPDPLTSVVLTIPVFLLYHLGILLLDKRNGVDWVSGLAFSLLDASVLAYVAVTLALSGALLAAVWLLRRRGHVRPVALMPIVVESSVWALLMLATVGWATQQVTAGLAAGGVALGPLEKLVLSAGAGFHEEVVFRVLLLSGAGRLFTTAARLPVVRGFALAALASSLLFSLVHHVGSLGDPFTLQAFVFRTFAGLFLSLVYVARGFAVAVYTHTLYDLMVFFLLAAR